MGIDALYCSACGGRGAGVELFGLERAAGDSAVRETKVDGAESELGRCGYAMRSRGGGEVGWVVATEGGGVGRLAAASTAETGVIEVSSSGSGMGASVLI